MSCYESEHGSIIIPTAEWTAFRKTLIKAHNDAQERDLADALKALEAMKAASKGKRGDNRASAEKEALARFSGCRMDRFGMEGSEQALSRHSRLFNLLYTVAEGAKPWAEKTVLRTPKKKDLNLIALTGDAQFDCGDGCITLRNADRTVVWSVSENNHAIEHARAYPMAKLLFGLLGKIEWTRGSGGKIVGNDEYNRDNRSEGGGGNYVTQEFRPLTKAEKEAKARAARSYSYGGYGYRW